MTSTMKTLGIDRLSVEERITLVHEIWDSIVTEPRHTPLSDEQCDELERRAAQHAQSPQDVVPWDEVKAETLKRLRR